ncbi:MAG: hypothetical protein AAGA93_10090 [Actinomycetota bacterium]
MEHPNATVASGPLLLGTRATERPADAGSTLVAGIAGASPARVDGGGLVRANGADWVLDWWIGADDRWYLPAREPAVRQHRSGPGPVVVTSMRIPSGDVTATAYPVMTGGRPATAVEIENRSPVPVALALAIRPIGLGGGEVRPHRLELIDGTLLTVDGTPALVLPRPPNQRVADGTSDVLAAVESGEVLGWDGPVSGPSATAACLFPLPHATSLRVAVLDADAAPDADAAARFRPDTLPGPDAVTRGWATVVDRAAGFGLPDPGLTELVGAARARLVLAAPGLADGIEAVDPRSARMLEALALFGHADECRPAVERLVRTFPARLPVEPIGDRSPAEAGADTLRAVAAAALLLGEETAEEALATAAQLLALVERAGDHAQTAVAASALARLAAAAGQPDAAAHLRGSLAVDGAGAGGPTATLEDVTALAGEAQPSGAWPPTDRADAAAAFLLATRSLLLRADAVPGAPARSGPSDPSDGAARRGRSSAATSSVGPTIVQLLPSMPTAWLGGQVEVHRAPAAGARVSFAIRWHGYRPALLWQVDGIDGDDGDDAGPVEPIRLTCPGLDPDWSSDEPRGETLLAGSSIALPAAPEPGDSFS